MRHCHGGDRQGGPQNAADQIIPAQVRIREDWYYTYACQKCKLIAENTPVVKAKKSPAVIPGSFASPEAIAQIMTQKFVMGSPLYRQEQELERMGVHLSYGTDCPVEDCNPFPNIYMAVTRKDRQGRPAGGFYPGECVDVETAIDAYTKESAYAEFQEDVKGRLMPGYYADMVLLDRDIFTVDPMEIKDILPVMTIVGGKVVYKK